MCVFTPLVQADSIHINGSFVQVRSEQGLQYLALKELDGVYNYNRNVIGFSAQVKDSLDLLVKIKVKEIEALSP